MKKYLLSLIMPLTFFVVSCNNAQNQSLQTKASNISKTTIKRYEVPSGMVTYNTVIKGKVMGSTIDGSGTQELYFKDWGNVELKKEDEKKVTHINIFGQKKTEVDETHTINKLDNGKSYSVDMKNKIIYVRDDPAMAMIKTFNDGDAVKTGEKMLESIGGKKIGKEKVLDYMCDVWQIPGGKQWIYKGVPLKLEMTMMGITTTQSATKAKFGINVPDKYFKLPDYPLQEIESFDIDDNNKQSKQNTAILKKMSFEDYKKLIKQKDPEAFKNMSKEELKMSYQLMQKMAQQMGQ